MFTSPDAEKRAVVCAGGAFTWMFNAIVLQFYFCAFYELAHENNSRLAQITWIMIYLFNAI